MKRCLYAVVSLAIAVASLAMAAHSETIHFDTLHKTVIEDRLRSVPGKNAEREQTLHDLFVQAGCPAGRLEEQAVKHAKVPNVLCTMAGQIASVIVVGAHFDCVSAGRGVVDNWSGASLLPSLLQSLKTVPRRHTFVFAGFTDEEKGMVGSVYYVNRLSKDDLKSISAMINIDSVGTSSTKLELDRGSRSLAVALSTVANSVHLPLGVVNVHAVGRSDSDTFQDRKVPSINIHSITVETYPILHSKRDRMEAIHIDEYYDSYRLITAYLAYLDDTLDR